MSTKTRLGPATIPPPRPITTKTVKTPKGEFMAKVSGMVRQVIDFEDTDENGRVTGADEVTYVEITAYENGTTQIQRKTATVDNYLDTVMEEAGKEYALKKRFGDPEARGHVLVKPLYLATAEIDRVAARVYDDNFSFSRVKAGDIDPDLLMLEGETATREDYARRLMRAIFAAEIGDPKAITYIDQVRRYGIMADMPPDEVQEQVLNLYERLAGDSGKRTLAPAEDSFWSSLSRITGVSEDDLSLSDTGLLIQSALLLNQMDEES